MNTSETLNWQEFKSALLQNPDLDLQFQYAENKWVAPSYHITEIKQAAITSVDCGGIKNEWTEVILQLWEPENQQQLKAMKVKKALEIINLVEKSLAINPLAIVKVEFGNAEFDTRQLLPKALQKSEENFIVDLRADVTQCKAINRGGSCGTPTTAGEECCSPKSTTKPAEMQNLAMANTCEPGSGCC